jgi:predicted DNA-binding protein
VKKRTTVWLPAELVERLKKLSRKTGAPMAELFRRAVEAYRGVLMGFSEPGKPDLRV